MSKKIPFYLFWIIPLSNLTNFKLLFTSYNQQLYYALLFVILAYLIINFKVKKINPFSVILLVTTACSLIFNTIPEYFDSTFRWFGWVLVFITLGPLVSNSKLLKCYYNLELGIVNYLEWLKKNA